MAATTRLRSSHHAASYTRLDTLPPEIRAVIYTHLCHNLCLEVSLQGKLSTENYPWQLSAVSRLLRNEILPILHDASQTYPLRLVCEGGRFPDEIRRRIPNKVLNRISIVTVWETLECDDLKPSLRTFPNLSELRLALSSIMAPNPFGRDYLASQLAGQNPPPLSDEDLAQLIDYVKQGQVMRIAAEMMREQERPREGLERDYLVEGTLYQVLSMNRRRRGFDVKMEAILTGYEEFEYFGHGCCGMIRVDDWDSGQGTYVDGCMTEPPRLYM